MPTLAHSQRGRRPREATPRVESMEVRLLLAADLARFPIPQSFGEIGSIAASTEGGVWIVAGSQVARLETSGDLKTFADFQGETNGVSAVSREGAFSFVTTEVTREDVSTPREHYREFVEIPLPDGSSTYRTIMGTIPAQHYHTDTRIDRVYTLDLNGNLSSEVVGTMKSSEYYPDSEYQPEMGFLPYPYRNVTPAPYLTPSITGLFPTSLAIGPGGTFWFADGEHDRVGWLSAGDSSEVETFTLSNGSEPGGITVGPDGSAWFTETGSGKIGRVGSDGQITEYTIPESINGVALETVRPTSIIGGTDGAFWFLQGGQLPIGRITTDGEISAYPKPAWLNLDFTQIDAAPDGNLYLFAGASGPFLLRPDGQVEETRVEFPAAGMLVGKPLIGADGSVWAAYRGRVADQQEIVRIPFPREAITGGLDPASDTGVSDSDGITADSQPTFQGQTTPGAQVLVALQPVGTTDLMPVASTTADANGHWRATAWAPLPDGRYSVAVKVTHPSSGVSIAKPLPVGDQGTLQIVTQGPVLTGVTLLPRERQVHVTYQDPVGLLSTSLLSREQAYRFALPGRDLPAGSIRSLRTWVMVTDRLSLDDQMPRRGRFLFQIDPSLVTDLAGNTLQLPGNRRDPAPNVYRALITYGPRWASRPFLLRSLPRFPQR